jgi:hypothetical protein
MKLVLESLQKAIENKAAASEKEAAPDGEVKEE